MAFDTYIYLAYRTGNDGTGDGSAGNPFKTFDGGAKALVEAGTVGEYSVVFTQDTSENCTLNTTGFPINTTDLICRILFANGIVAQGTGVFFTVAGSGSHQYGVIGEGVHTLGYTAAISRGSAFQQALRIEKCYLSSATISGARPIYLDIENSFLDAVNIEQSNTTYQVRRMIGNTFVNCVNLSIYPISTWDGKLGGLESNIFVDSKIQIRRKTTNTTYQALGLNVFKNCEFLLFDENNLGGIYTACNSIQDLKDLYLSVFGEAATDEFDKFIFDDVSIDVNGFQSNTDAYNLNRSLGYGRFASTALASIPSDVNYDPAKFSVVSEVIYRTVTTTESFDFIIPEVPRAGFVRRVVLFYENSDPSFDNSFTITLKRSKDGVNFDSGIIVESGLIDVGGGVYDFDYVNLDAKAAKVTITVNGTQNSLSFQAGLIEFYDLEDQLSQAGGREVVNQLEATGQGYLLDGGYSFVMPTDLRQYMTDVNKSNYTFKELEDEISPNLLGIVYNDSPNNTNIEKFTVQTDTKPVTVYTFKK